MLLAALEFLTRLAIVAGLYAGSYVAQAGEWFRVVGWQG